MATLTVKNLPDDLYERLKSSAKEKRRSINAEAIVRIEESLSLHSSAADENSAEVVPLHEAGGDYTAEGSAAVHVDASLIEEARRWSRSDARGTLSEALLAYVARMKRLSLLDLAGKIEFEQGYDYKAARRQR